MTPRGAGCLGKPLVRFCEGQESPGVWTRYCGTAAKAGGKRRRRTSSCSSGRLLPTRREVYRARDTKLDQDVALKVLPQAFTDDPERLARFEREAKVLVYSPPLDQLLPTMHAVVPALASALCVFFFGTLSGRNTWVHYLAAHRTATHRRVRPSMVVVWASLDVRRHLSFAP